MSHPTHSQKKPPTLLRALLLPALTPHIPHPPTDIASCLSHVLRIRCFVSLTGCESTGNKQQQPKPVGDAFVVFQDQFQSQKGGGTRAKGATAAGLPKPGLIKQTKPKAGIHKQCSLAGLLTKATVTMQIP